MRKTVIFLLFIGLWSLQLQSQNTGPVAPEAMSFEPVDATDMVNLLTGDFSYVLPLLSVPGPGGGYPIALSYHGGIGMEQEASWVGLGWNINVGALNRGVNGYPDDFNNDISTTIIYDDGNIYTKNFVGVNLPLQAISVGATVSWGSSWSVSGHVAYSGVYFGTAGSSNGGYITGGVGIPGGNVGMTASSDDLSLSGALGPIDATHNISSGTTNMGLTLRHGSISLGVSLGSDGISVGGNFAGSHVSFYQSIQSQDKLKSATWGWMVPAYIINFGQNKTKVWYYDNQDYYINGTLSLNSIYKENEDVFRNDWVQHDKYLSDIFIFPNSDEEVLDGEKTERSDNLMLPAYDSYSVSAQGLNGNIAPRIFNTSLLVGQTRVEDEFSVKNGRNFYDNYKEDIWYFHTAGYAQRNDPNAEIHNYSDFERMDRIPSNLNPYFYFEGYPTSSLQCLEVGFKNFDSNYTNPEGGHYILEAKSANGFEYKAGNIGADNRRKEGNFVQYFTNREIVENLDLSRSKGFIETNSISEDVNFSNPRENEELFSQDGIGAFVITSSDGMTYHYSLPVYQFEEFYRHKETGSNDFFLRIQKGKYAYTWLLTAITGPDYIDKGTIGLDDEDHGYWVEFNYGKWSDGYTWKLPFAEDVNYKYGTKQIYYLNSIETKSHIAYFIKDIREDGLGATINENLTGQASKNELKGFVPGTDLIGYYYGAAYFKVFEYDQHKSTSTNFESVKSLKLREIILIDKKDRLQDFVNEVDLVQNSVSNYSELNIYKEISWWTRTTNIITGEVFDNYGDESDRTVADAARTYNSYYQDYILDVNDSGLDDLRNNAIKIISFEYDQNGLVKNTPNSNGLNSSKLSLNKVFLKGKSGIITQPPYIFDYYNSEITYDENSMDIWGYHRDTPEAWSLKNITTPLGSTIDIRYEADEYTTFAAFDEEFVVFEVEELSVHLSNPNDEECIFQEDDYVYATIKIPDYYNFNDFASDIDRVEVWGEMNCYLLQNQVFMGSEKYPINEVVELVGTYSSPRMIKVKINFSKMIENNFERECKKFKNLNIKVYYDKQKYSGGGIRVSQIKLSGDGNEYLTNYSYLNPSTDLTSGITTYAPFDGKCFVPYASEIPGPGVFYEYVSVESGIADNIQSKTLYKFEVPKVTTSTNIKEFNLGDQFEVSTIQDNTTNDNLLVPYESGDFERAIKARSSLITDRTRNIGRLLSVTNYNSKGDILSEMINDYDLLEPNGVNQETFYYLKNIRKWKSTSHAGAIDNYYFVAASRRTYPSVLTSTITRTAVNTVEVFNEDFDNCTGIANTARTINSNGTEYKSISIPAYLVSSYSEMGSKVDGVSNKNMLSQKAASIEYKKKPDGAWVPLSASIQTWKGDWNNYVEWDASGDASYAGKDALPDGSDINIWRKHKSFIWKSPLDENGYYTNFDNYDSPEELKDNFPGWTDENYTGTSGNSNGWKLNSEIVRYNHYSTPVEAKDINGDYISSKTDPNHMYTTVSATNSSYISFAASSFEYKKPLNGTGVPYIFEGEIISTLSSPANLSYDSDNYDANTMITGVMAHTGNYYGVIPSGSVGFKYKATNSSNAVLIRGTDYRASVWVHKNSPGTSYLKANIDGTLTSSQKLVGVYGDWKLYYLDFNVPANTQSFTVYVEASGNEVYVDDFRVSPFEAVVNSYTYDNTGLVTAIINNDNFATKYEYDPAGRLIATYRETPKGFVKTSRHEYRYVGGYGISFDNTLISSTGGSVNFNITNPNNDGLSCETNADWLTLQSQTTNLVVFSAPAYNNCDNYRSCQATITNKVTGESKTYTVRQEGLKISLQEYHHGTNFPSTGDPGDVIMPIVRVLKNGDEPAFSEVEFIFSTDPYGNNPIVTSTEPVVFTSSNYLDISTSLKIPSSYDGHGSHYLIIRTCSGEELPGINTMYIDNPPPYQFTVSVSKSAPGTGHYTLSANPNPSTGPYTYSWNLGQGITTPVVGTPTSKGVECSGYGTFSVTVTYTGTQYASTSVTYNGEINSDGVLLLPFD